MEKYQKVKNKKQRSRTTSGKSEE